MPTFSHWNINCTVKWLVMPCAPLRVQLILQYENVRIMVYSYCLETEQEQGINGLYDTVRKLDITP